ncbi:coiled-coil domain-containing protein 12 isoform X2 [Dasypus novemcinctus]|nr:coiled-coil domain-containing protein 12 isoform X2 [Dasypus novemcinctus]
MGSRRPSSSEKRRAARSTVKSTGMREPSESPVCFHTPLPAARGACRLSWAQRRLPCTVAEPGPRRVSRAWALCSLLCLSHRTSEMVTERAARDLRLRNYVPEDEDLKRRRVPQARPVAVEEKVKEQLEAAKPEPVIEEVDLANLAPRKPDWDLKRDVAKKLEKLEKRTQRAIAELIRERLKGQEDSLASAVGATSEQEACDSD